MNTFELAVLKTMTSLRDLGQRVAAGAADEEGQTTAEYVAVIVLIAGLIGLVAGSDTIRQAIIDAITAAFGNVEDQVTSS